MVTGLSGKDWANAITDDAAIAIVKLNLSAPFNGFIVSPYIFI
jgi:hypothetical protein